MTNYRLIMRLLLAGSSYREIQARCGAAHATIAKARKTLDHHQITTPPSSTDCMTTTFTAWSATGG